MPQPDPNGGLFKIVEQIAIGAEFARLTGVIRPNVFGRVMWCGSCKHVFQALNEPFTCYRCLSTTPKDR